MNVKTRTIVINVKAALATMAFLALGPLNRYYERRLCLWDTEPDLKTLEKTVIEKFNELQEGMKKNVDNYDKALGEVKKYGDTIEAKTADKLKTQGEENLKVQAELKALIEKCQARTLELEQKVAKKVSVEDEQKLQKTAGQMLVESAEFKDMVTNKLFNSRPVELTRKALISNATTLDGNQPLVGPDRRPGIITPITRRLTIRDLMPQIPTSSDVVQYAKELVFTNNAGPQGGLTSPTISGGEGEIKPESTITFQLVQAAVITLAHFIAASRQVLSDATQLQGYIDSRLTYGLKLEEELELLTGNGQAGKLNGINNQAAAFTYGASGTQGLDVLLLSFLQIALTNLEASGVVLHPYDWFKVMMLKDTQGRYLFSNPHDTEMPRVWGKAVVPTQSQTQGQFTTGAFDMGAAIYDREGVTIRVSDQHADFFARNLVAILCEERLTLALYRPEAFVYGPIGAF